VSRLVVLTRAGGSVPVEFAAVTARPAFADILRRVTDVEGWMTDDQARRLHDRAVSLGAGEKIVEIGSFRGRSMIVLALSAGDGVELVAIDPHGGGDRGPQEIDPDQERGDDDNAAFEANLSRAGVRDRVRHVRRMSGAALAEVDGHVDLLYIDGAHRFGPARDDIVRWGARVRPGGTMLIHDSFSSIGVTLALTTTTFVGAGWRYVGRSQSMAEYRREDLGVVDRVRSGLRQAAQLPWFVRNVVIKVLLTVKAYPLTRLLGHTTRDWPY
jgi:predicted O-methyltransferase YrrM